MSCPEYLKLWYSVKFELPMVSFSKYICSFLPEILLLVSSCNVLYVLVCTHFVITPFSEVEICREVFNVSEFHFSEVYFFQTWYFTYHLTPITDLDLSLYRSPNLLEDSEMWGKFESNVPVWNRWMLLVRINEDLTNVQPLTQWVKLFLKNLQQCL